jgi:L-ascorbate 6-phosphate lactonase
MATWSFGTPITPAGHAFTRETNANEVCSMIEPILFGDALLQEIGSTGSGPGVLSVWWLGQSGYLLKSRSGTLVIDPYLSEHLTRKYEGTNKPHVRMTRAPFRGEELQDVDLALSSHKHSDHLDPGTMPDLLAASPTARLVLPASLVEHAVSLGLPDDRLVGLEAGQSFESHGFSVRAVPSAHEGLDTDVLGRHLYLGYVIEAEGLRLYHSGDSLAYDGLTGWLGADPFDVLFLPINGRDPARGVAGNMSAAEAVDLASAVRPRFVVPHHYEMFTFNTVPIGDFEAEARRLPEGVVPRILRCGERWEIKR